MKLLIVEDEILIAKSLQMVLAKKGFEITGIASGFNKAVALVKENKPDLVLSDINLKSDKNGIDVARWLNEYDLTISIIFMTGYSFNGFEETLKDVRFLSIIEKPVEDKDIIKVINDNQL